MQTNFYARHFNKVMTLMGLGFISFFGIALFAILFGWTDHLLKNEVGIVILRLIRWGGVEPHAEHYEAMISIIYVVWGWFLLKIAKFPEKNIAFLDFTAIANIGHFGLMTVMALVMPNEKIHLLGDLLLGWSILVLFIVFWLPTRRSILQETQ